MEAAKKEIMIMTSAKGMTRFLQGFPVQRYFEKKIRIRIMAPINASSMETAKKLSACCQIKHIATDYLRILVVDDEHFFQLKVPSPERETIGVAAHLEDAFYTNDTEYVKRIREMLDNAWETALDFSEAVSKSGMRSPPIQVSPLDSASKVVEEMLRNNVGSVFVVENKRPIGIITEKDILERAVKAGKNLGTTCAKDIMSSPVIDVDHEEPLTEALSIMRRNGIRRLAVTTSGELLGVLTERRALGQLGLRSM
jgi:CBS domain-containing protein